jgi:hypothetical protein
VFYFLNIFIFSSYILKKLTSQEYNKACLPALTFGPKGPGIFFFIKIFKHLDNSYNITILKKERIAIIIKVKLGREIMVNQERIAIIIKVKLGREIMVNQERIAIIGVLFLILSFYVSLVIYSFFPEN